MEHYEFQDRVIDSLARLETQMEGLVGNGQPGRVNKLEAAVESLSRWRWIVVGIAITISAIVHFVFKY